MIRARVFFLPAASLVASLTFAPTALAQTPPAAPTPAQAQDVQLVRDEVAKLKQDFDLLRQQYDDRLAKLEERLKDIGGSSGPAAATVQDTGAAKDAATAAPPVLVPADAPVLTQTPDQTGAAQGSLAGSSKVFNPDMSVIGNFVGVGRQEPDQHAAVAAAERSRSGVPGRRRSVRARRLLSVGRTRRPRGRGGLHHVHVAAGATCC